MTKKFKNAAIVTHGGFLVSINYIQSGKKSNYFDYKNGQIYEYDLDNLLKKIAACSQFNDEALLGEQK
jgi:hypothetical protein